MTIGLSFRSCIVLLVCAGLLIAGTILLNPEPLRAADPSTDVYFHTPGVPSGPSAP